ncbi:unannotated protein [freshwater metagenome]|uniref:Unannotated protein n=1 Tax=freshwater metagenome TaxID=449393 RepID=A0A6J7KMR9_9ZZZZ|nr:DUF262 domain-containing protein [Actinomycetota bacterium]
MTGPREAPEADELVLFDEQVPVSSAGGESEEDVVSRLGAARANVSATDWTVETLLSQLRKGRIDLSPRFQRRAAWVNPTKSRFIESVILNYPIPQIVLAEKQGQPGHFFVIDGKQRLLALRQFFATAADDPDFSSYRLSGLTILTDLKGMGLARLQTDRPDLVAQLENHTIRTVAIRNWGSEEFLYTLFLRLNTGSVPLSPQELRQALVPGPFVDWADEASGASPGLRLLLGNDGPDRRMVDAELLVRHIGLATARIPYGGNLKDFLDKTCGAFNADWQTEAAGLAGRLVDLEGAIGTALAIFGDDGVCRKWNGKRYERALNRAVFDVQMHFFAYPDVRDRAVEAGPAVAAAFRSLCQDDPGFLRAITTTTKSSAAFRDRFDGWRTALAAVIGELPPLPPSLTAAPA